MIGLHLAALAVYYILLKTNLIPAMIHGRRIGVSASGNLSKPHIIAGITLLALCVGLAQLAPLWRDSLL